MPLLFVPRHFAFFTFKPRIPGRFYLATSTLTTAYFLRTKKSHRDPGHFLTTLRTALMDGFSKKVRAPISSKQLISHEGGPYLSVQPCIQPSKEILLKTQMACMLIRWHWHASALAMRSFEQVSVLRDDCDATF